MATLFILACSARKNPQLKQMPLPARDAYWGQAFKFCRIHLERVAAKWCILSGGYGILWPDTLIEWYDTRIDPDPYRPWDGEFDHIKQKQYGRLVSAQRIVVLGSRLYAQSAEVMLDRVVEAPVAGLPIGEMLAVLKSGSWLETPAPELASAIS